jgi:hypothetical protein
VELDCRLFANRPRNRTWTSLGRFVRRGEKGIFILAPMVGNKRKKDETEKTEQDTGANETQGTLYGFRGVHVFCQIIS